MTISPALFPTVTVTVVRDSKIRTALKTNQIAVFVTVPSWKKIKRFSFLIMCRFTPSSGTFSLNTRDLHEIFSACSFFFLLAIIWILYCQTALRRVQITPKADANIYMLFVLQGPIKQVFSQRASDELDWSYEKTARQFKLFLRWRRVRVAAADFDPSFVDKSNE